MTQQPLFWVSTWKIWKHWFTKTYVPQCSLQHYLWWPWQGHNHSVLHQGLDKDAVQWNSAQPQEKMKCFHFVYATTWIDLANIMLSKISQEKLRTMWLHSYVSYKTENHRQTTVWWLSEGTGVVGVVKGQGDQIYSDGRLFGLQVVGMQCNIQMYHRIVHLKSR